MPVRAASSSQNARWRSSERRPSATAASSPNSASVAGASIPAAARQAAGPPASTTVTARPRWAARQAMPSPMGPPPITTQSRTWGTLALTAVTPRAHVSNARLYFVCEARPEALLRAVCAAGVDVIQLRDRALDDDGIVRAARAFRAAADATGALFVLNDAGPGGACRADGVHVGQGDADARAARALVGPDAVLGMSTHSRPVRPPRRPTGRRHDLGGPRVGDADQAGPPGGRPRLRPPRRRRTTPAKPWFAIGGIG
jgi:thiamine-phosphate pyrophosphorylase